MDRGAWWATVHGVAKSQTRLSDLARIHRILEGAKCYENSFGKSSLLLKGTGDLQLVSMCCFHSNLTSVLELLSDLPLSLPSPGGPWTHLQGTYSFRTSRMST